MKRFLAWRKRMALFVGFAALLASPVRAELPQEVKDILEKNIEATGGRDALSEIKSSRLVGEFNIAAMGMKGRSEVVQLYPDKIYSVQELPGIGKIAQAFDGEVGWSEDPMQGFRYLSEGEVSTLRQNDSFDDLLAYEERFVSGELLPETEVGGEATVAIKLTSIDSGEEQTRYFSKANGLLLRIDTIADMGPMGKLPATMFVKSYAEHEGIKYPKEVEMTNAGIVITVSFESLEINPEIEDSLFSAPQ